MLSKLKTKIRALIEDWEQTDTETFEYTNSNIFTLEEDNVSSITKVLKNAEDITELATTSLDTSNSKVTITLASGDSWTSGDDVEISYKFYNYSDSELTEYIRASLVYYSIYAHSEEDFELSSNSIYPTPDNRALDLIALISAILIRPDWNQYDLPNLRVRYNNRLPKDQKIERLCAKFVFAWGYNSIIEFN